MTAATVTPVPEKRHEPSQPSRPGTVPHAGADPFCELDPCACAYIASLRPHGVNAWLASTVAGARRLPFPHRAGCPCPPCWADRMRTFTEAMESGTPAGLPGTDAVAPTVSAVGLSGASDDRRTDSPEVGVTRSRLSDRRTPMTTGERVPAACEEHPAPVSGDTGDGDR